MSEEFSRTLELMRGQRHSFMNHLQVISGWLQLGKPDRALQYIAQASARLEAEGKVLHQTADPQIGLFVMQVGLMAEPYGVTIDWQWQGPVDTAALPDARAQIQAALLVAAAAPDGSRTLMVVLSTPVVVHTATGPGAG